MAKTKRPVKLISFKTQKDFAMAKRAARIEGRDVNDWIVRAVVAAAETVIRASEPKQPELSQTA